jgi:hypothetical protein
MATQRRVAMPPGLCELPFISHFASTHAQQAGRPNMASLVVSPFNPQFAIRNPQLSLTLVLL